MIVRHLIAAAAALSVLALGTVAAAQPDDTPECGTPLLVSIDHNSETNYQLGVLYRAPHPYTYKVHGRPLPLYKGETLTFRIYHYPNMDHPDCGQPDTITVNPYIDVPTPNQPIPRDPEVSFAEVVTGPITDMFGDPCGQITDTDNDRSVTAELGAHCHIELTIEYGIDAGNIRDNYRIIDAADQSGGGVGPVLFYLYVTGEPAEPAVVESAERAVIEIEAGTTKILDAGLWGAVDARITLRAHHDGLPSFDPATFSEAEREVCDISAWGSDPRTLTCTSGGESRRWQWTIIDPPQGQSAPGPQPQQQPAAQPKQGTGDPIVVQPGTTRTLDTGTGTAITLRVVDGSPSYEPDSFSDTERAACKINAWRSDPRVLTCGVESWAWTTG